MNAYLQGYRAALIKLGLSGSAISATSTGTTPGTLAGAKPTTGTTTPKTTAPKQVAWSHQNKIEPKMHEMAWQTAQKDLDTGEARVTSKVDQWQQPMPLPTGSA